jgi:hypothetical protein
MPHPQSVSHHHVESLRQVLVDVAHVLEGLRIDGCELDDLQEVLDLVIAELGRNEPNVATLGTYLNSIARSLRSQPNARTVLVELDAAMRDANVPTNWEH